MAYVPKSVIDEVYINPNTPAPATPDLWVDTDDDTGGIDYGYADTRYVKKAGDTMTGNLGISNVGSQATIYTTAGTGTTGQQLTILADQAGSFNMLVASTPDWSLRKKLIIDGDPSEVARDPTTALGIASKQYVDKGMRSQMLASTNNVPNNSYTMIPLATQDYALGGGGLSADSQAISTNAAGLYVVYMNAVWSPNATGRRLIGINNSNSAGPGFPNQGSAQGHASLQYQSVVVVINVTSPPYKFYFWGLQDSGAALGMQFAQTVVQRIL